ncbi:MAG: ATP-binding protein [Salinivirgaceae bacterium]|jgi:two-component system NtrC family sensor kinase|nr:ATP-binding protein [Salinivirgaceae bacterium]
MLKRYLRFRSSIFGRVIYTITILSIILFVSFGSIFRYVYREHLNTVIRQSGNNVGSMVEGALYYSMLMNDKGALQSTIDNINTISGIDEVNMYDQAEELVYSSYVPDSIHLGNPECKTCHADIKSMFHPKEKSYSIVDIKSACLMNKTPKGHRQLLIRKPILNEPSCYTSSCHAHNAKEKELGSLIIKMSLTDLDSAIKRSSTEFFLLATLTTILLVLFLFLFTRRKIKMPLHSIIVASEAVANGDKTTRLEITPNLLDDMRLVSEAFNNMLDNLHSANTELKNWSQQLEYKVQKKSEKLVEIQKELIHIERIASLGKLSSSVAHEINNPLSGVLTYTKLVYKLLDKLDIEPVSKESMLKYLKVIETETKRCGDIVKSLLDFSRKDTENFEKGQLHKILKNAYDLMSHQLKISNINFYTDFLAENDIISCRENQIKQACIAILVNASEAVSENGEIMIRTSNPDNDHIKFEISDNGVGIDPEDIPHIFEPFFSAKQKVSGVGLGLAIVHGIIQNHKGKIEIDSEIGEHTTISIILPLLKT